MSIETEEEIQKAIRRGLRALERPEPLRLSEWAAEHFYLSPESSYIEGSWEAYPYQIAPMDCMSNDDIREVTWIKSARVGYTKMILAAMAYFAEHKHRNQIIWQPVDDDADDFVKSELNPMLRDVPAVQRVFPDFDKQSKGNTMRQKAFIGSTLHIRGGKAAKNYRRISADVAIYDELDGFDTDIESEGSPLTLGDKRVEGSTFPKSIAGSTPKTKSESMIEARAEAAELFFRYHVPCPHCDTEIALRWGAKDSTYGMKWTNNDPSTAAHLCEHCGGLFTQDQYLDVWESGRWMTDDGIWIDTDGLFRTADKEIIEPPLSVGFHLWTAYSPQTSWTQIVREFLNAKDDPSKLKTFINTTLGEAWEEDESQKLDHEILYTRREHYPAQVPGWVTAITFGVDTQDDRFEIQFDGWGPGEERASIAYVRLYGDPSRPVIWDKLAESLRRQFRREDNIIMSAVLGCQDHGGHYSDEVTAFSRKMGVRWLIPVKGSSQYGKPVAVFPRRPNKNRVYLTEVGTDTAKDLLYQRLMIQQPGPGYWHWPVSEEFDETYFRQLTAEERVPRWRQGSKHYIWEDRGRPHEPWDCSVYSLAAVRIAQQHFGLNLEAQSAEPFDPEPAPIRRRKSTFWS